MTRQLQRALCATALLLLCAACGTDTVARTQVMVVIDAESRVRAMTKDVDFEVRTRP